MSKVSLETNPGRQRRSTWGLKNEEFVADFCLVSRRTLSPLEHQIFRFHYLLGADWKICCMKLKLERGAFFHEIYRIEEKLGRVFRELRPHPLFPVDEYFNSTGRYDKRPSIQALFPVENGDCGFMEEIVETEVVPKRKKKSKKVLKFPIKFAA